MKTPKKLVRDMISTDEEIIGPTDYDWAKELRICPRCGSHNLTWKPGDKHCKDCGKEIINPRW